jgi:tetratricopeptide (TPR) repeat protein
MEEGQAMKAVAPHRDGRSGQLSDTHNSRLRRDVSLLIVRLAFLLLLAAPLATADDNKPSSPMPPPTAEQQQQLKRAKELNQRVFELWKAGRSREALPLAREVLKIRQQILGPEHKDTAQGLLNLAAQYDAIREYADAEPLYVKSLEIQKKVLGENHPDYAQGLNNLAYLYWKQSNYSRAEPLFRRALEIQKKSLGENHPDYAQSLHNLAALYQAKGDYARAEPLYRQAMEITKNLRGENHLEYALSVTYLAGLYSSQGDFTRAEPLFRQVLAIQKKVLGEVNPAYANTLNILALLYQAQRDFTRAEPLFRQALAIQKKVLGENNPAYANTLNNLARLYDAQGDFTRAEPLFRQALVEIRKKDLGESHPLYASGLNTLARLYYDHSDYLRAEPLCRQALEIRKKVLGENHPDYAASLYNLASVYDKQGDYPRAEPLFRQAMELNKKIRGENHPDYAESVNALAYVYHEQGDYSQAELFYRQAMEIHKRIRGENHPDYANSLNNLGLLYKDQGDYQRAEPLLRQALEIHRKVPGENDSRYANSLNSLATLFDAQGDLLRAEPLYRRALEIRRKVLGENHPDYADSLNNLASLYQAQGDYLRAEPLFRQASEIWHNVLGENHPRYAHSLNNLAGLYSSQGDFLRAEPLYRRALEIRRKVLGEKHPDYALSLHNLASLYQDQADYARAEPLFRQVLETREKLLGKNHPDYAMSLHNLAGLYQEQGDYPRAEPLYRQTREIQEKLLGENHPDYALNLNNLAVLYRAQGDNSRAEPLFRKSVTIIRGHLEVTAPIESERQQLAMLQQNRHYLDSYLSFAIASGQYSEPAYRELLAWKGMVLRRNRLARAAAQSPELTATFMHLQHVTTQLTHLAWTTPDPRQEANWRQRVAKLSAEKEQLEAELSARSAGYRQAKRAVPLEDLQAALSKDSRLVDFVEYWHYSPADKKSKTKGTFESRLLGFVVAPDRPVEMVALGAMRPINEAIETWRATFGMSAEGAEAARLLRERLWAPIEGKLHGAKIVLISPDGTLGRLPFGALPGKTPGTFLIEERTLAVVPVPQLIPQLVQEKGRKHLRKKLLLLGNVDYDAPPAKAPEPLTGTVAVSSNENGDRPRSEGLMLSSRSLLPGTLHFGPLPGTESEIAAIEELYKIYHHDVESDGVTPLRKSRASKEAFLAEARRHAYLHLATHGFFIEEKVRVAALGSRDARPLGDMLHGLEAGATYPALLSGLALAGANRSGKADAGETADGNEGILTAEEIGTQNLDGVELVVLSACESGLGKQASGEGLLGLQRSFQSAGARNVVASLWPVDDQATCALMKVFYTELWKENKPPLEALREAQLYVYRHPDEIGKLADNRGLGVSRPVTLPDGAAVKPGSQTAPVRQWAGFVLAGVGDW